MTLSVYQPSFSLVTPCHRLDDDPAAPGLAVGHSIQSIRRMMFSLAPYHGRLMVMNAPGAVSTIVTTVLTSNTNTGRVNLVGTEGQEIVRSYSRLPAPRSVNRDT